MTEYSYYLPMPYADACRLARLQAQQYALERMCGLMRDDIMRTAFTESEQSTLHTLLARAQDRTAAGLAEYDGYKRCEPVLVEVGEAML